MLQDVDDAGPSGWSTMQVCQAVLVLMGSPAADSPLNCDAGNLLRSGDNRGYDSLAHMYTVDMAQTPVSRWRLLQLYVKAIFGALSPLRLRAYMAISKYHDISSVQWSAFDSTSMPSANSISSALIRPANITRAVSCRNIMRKGCT